METTILSELSRLNGTVAEVAERQKFTHVMLFSGEFGGIQHVGKLAELAAQITALAVKIESQEVRIIDLERDKIRRDAAEKAAIRTSAKIGGIAGVVAGLAISALDLLVHWLRK